MRSAQSPHSLDCKEELSTEDSAPIKVCTAYLICFTSCKNMWKSCTASLFLQLFPNTLESHRTFRLYCESL